MPRLGVAEDMYDALKISSASGWAATLVDSEVSSVGTGIAGRVAEWADANTLQAATLIKSGAGILTLSAAGDYTLTVPVTGTAAVINLAGQTFTGEQIINRSTENETLLTINGDWPTLALGDLLAIYSNSGDLVVRVAGDGILYLHSSDINKYMLLYHNGTQGMCTGYGPLYIYGWIKYTMEGGETGNDPVLNVSRFYDYQTAGVRPVLSLSIGGTRTAGDGGSLTLVGNSSSTNAQTMGAIEWLWNDATHATRKADLVLSAYDTAQREGLRIRGAGSAVAIGLFGVTPIARPTTSSAAATFAQNSGNAVNDASTFDGYTLLQVVKALRDLGALT